MSTPHNHTVEVLTFTGIGLELDDAIKNATELLNEWYQQQDVLWTGEGTSAYQFSTAAFVETMHTPNTDYTQTYCVYIITVFNTLRKHIP